MNDKFREEQVARAVSGDQDALQYLILYYHSTLRRAVISAIDASLRNRIDPDDLLQDVYVAVFKSVQGRAFTGAGAFYKWLETAAKNQVKNKQRDLLRQKRDIRREAACQPDLSTSLPGLLERIAASDSTPSRKLMKDEASAAALSCLARLTDEQREVVRLRFLEGRPVKEVADHLNKSEDSVHKLCFRGLKSLAEHMESITRYLSHM